jgi:hypothetical protein
MYAAAKHQALVGQGGSSRIPATVTASCSKLDQQSHMTCMAAELQTEHFTPSLMFSIIQITERVCAVLYVYVQACG